MKLRNIFLSIRSWFMKPKPISKFTNSKGESVEMKILIKEISDKF